MRDAVGAEKLARGEVAPATQAAEDSRVAQAFERPLQVAVDSGVSGVGRGQATATTAATVIARPELVAFGLH